MKSAVYFIRVGVAVKVGVTTDLRFRYAEIARSKRPEKATLIGAIRGGKELERTFHDELSAFNTHGEWFAAVPIVLALIDHNVRSRGLEGEDAFEITHAPKSVREEVALNEMRFVDEAVQITARLSDAALSETQGNRETSLHLVSAKYGIPRSLLWTLRYRPPKYLTAAQYSAIQSAALVASAAARVAREVDAGE